MQHNNEQPPNFPKPIEVFIIIILSFIFIVSITQALVLLFVPDLDESSQSAISQKIFSTIGQLGFLIIPIVYIRSRNLSYREVFRLKLIPASLVFWSIIAGLGISVVVDELDRIVTMLVPAPEFLGELAESMRIKNFGDFSWLFLGTVIIAPITEEFLIRGFLQNSLEKHLDVTRAVIYASLAWTIIHFVLYWAIQIFIMGIVFGLLAWKSRSVFPAVIGHGINNGLALLFNNIPQEKFSGIYSWGDHVSPLVLIIAFGALVVGVQQFYRHIDKSGGMGPNQI